MGFSSSKKRSIIAIVAAVSLIIVSVGVASNMALAEIGNADIVRLNLNGKGQIVEVKADGRQSMEPTILQNLPVRVVTSYSYNGKTTSDPQTIAGKTGVVRVEVALYNQTGRLEKISAKANGKTVTQTRWVSTPMSSAASVRLPGNQAKQVIKEDGANTGKIRTGTNGVVGLDSKSNTIIQWAGITGIKGDTARFVLVMNAKNFHVPSFDIIVQPGFGINLNTAVQKQETELVVSTIKTLQGAQNMVGESGQSLAKARQTLMGASGQIGRKTIADLKASNGQVEMSTRDLVARLGGIDSRAKDLFSQAYSSVAGRLQQTTAVVKELLGNPDAPAPIIAVDNQNCKITVNEVASTGEAAEGTETAGQTSAPSVLQVIKGLSARLDALSNTTDECQKLILADLDRLFGPQNPDQHTCQTDSLTCEIWYADAEMRQLVDAQRQQGAELVKRLKAGTQDDAVKNVQMLQAQLKDVGTNIDQLKENLGGPATDQKIAALADATVQLESPLKGLEKDFDAIAEKAKNVTDLSANQDKDISAAKRIVCIASGKTKSEDPELSGKYQMNEATALELAKLLDGTDCPTTDEAGKGTYEGDKALVPTSQETMFKRDQEIRQKITDVREIVAPTADNTTAAGGRKEIIEARAVLDQINKAIDGVKTERNKNVALQNERLKALEEKYSQSLNVFEQLAKNAGTVSTEIATVSADLDTYLGESQRASGNKINRVKTNLLVSTNATRNAVQNSNSTAFGGLARTISGEARRLNDHGTAAVEGVRTHVEGANNRTAAATSKLFAKNRQEIHGVSDRAVKDTNAVGSLLLADITRLLADMGLNEGKSGGLLEAVPVPPADLGVTNVKLAATSAHTSATKAAQRPAQTATILEQSAIRAALARLETPGRFADPGAVLPPAWYSFHLDNSDK
ncbi:MAG: hypothetical protein Q4A71_08065 [Actinomycetaceae bacterium]|nr:hypothetical protein [Actinomycetaceae bacterium]